MRLVDVAEVNDVDRELIVLLVLVPMVELALLTHRALYIDVRWGLTRLVNLFHLAAFTVDLVHFLHQLHFELFHRFELYRRLLLYEIGYCFALVSLICPSCHLEVCELSLELIDSVFI